MTLDPDDFGVDPVERDDVEAFVPPSNGTNGHDTSSYGRDRQEPPDYSDLQPPPEMLVQSAPGLPADTRKKVTDALRLGLTERLAAQYAGLTYERYLKWRRQDQTFSEAVKSAEAMGAFAWMARIEQAAVGGDWRAAAWKLSHRFPTEYGRQVLEHGGEGGGAIPVRFVTVEVPNGSTEDVSEGPDMPPLPEPDIYEEEIDATPES
jgi:hypothetical protein